MTTIAEAMPEQTADAKSYPFQLGTIPLGQEAEFELHGKAAELMGQDRSRFDALCNGAPAIVKLGEDAITLTKMVKVEPVRVVGRKELYIVRSMLESAGHLVRIRGRVMPYFHAISLIDPLDGSLFALSHKFVKNGSHHPYEFDRRPTTSKQRNKFHHLPKQKVA